MLFFNKYSTTYTTTIRIKGSFSLEILKFIIIFMNSVIHFVIEQKEKYIVVKLKTFYHNY